MGNKHSGRKALKPTWYASRKSYFVKYKGKQYNLGPDKDIAEIRFHDLVGGSIADPKHEFRPDVDYTVGELFDLYLDFVKRERAPASYVSKKENFQQFKNGNPRLYNRLAIKLLPRHLTEWINSRDDWSDTYKNILVSCIQTCYSWAKRNRLIADDPVRGMDKPQPTKRDLGKYAAIDDLKPYLDVMEDDKEFFWYLTFLYETGCRPFEAANLTFDDVDFQEGRASMKNGKAKGIKIRTIILTDKAIDAIRNASDRSTGFVFLNQKGTPYSHQTAGIKLRRLQERHKHLKKITLYEIRHGFATRLLMKTKDAALCATLMGNSVRMVVDTYNHLLSETAYLREQLQGPEPKTVKPKKEKKKTKKAKRKKAKRVAEPFYPATAK